MRHFTFGEPAAEEPPSPGRVSYAEVRTAMPHDPVAFRGQILYGVIRENGYMTGTGIAF